MNCAVGNLEAQMQMDVAFLLWSLFSESPLQKRNPMFMLWRYHRYGCFQAWTQCKIWNPTSDLVACFRFCVSDRREEERGKEIQILDWASDLVAYFRFCVSERESGVRKRGEKKLRTFFRRESLTEAASVSNIAEVDLRWNWCVILIDVAIFNWAK